MRQETRWKSLDMNCSRTEEEAAASNLVLQSLLPTKLVRLHPWIMDYVLAARFYRQLGRGKRYFFTSSVCHNYNTTHRNLQSNQSPPGTAQDTHNSLTAMVHIHKPHSASAPMSRDTTPNMHGDPCTCPFLITVFFDPLLALLSPTSTVCNPQRLADQSPFLYAIEYATWSLIMFGVIMLGNHINKRIIQRIRRNRSGEAGDEEIELVDFVREG
ncbi:hypothetical protein FB567DRAFT_50344 [Paraphoma chrysanthemicola]|uniref:Uncharacterized protein n=1 Tax=Paraphoma chrysanthemicola TaxID=798071 RepID=A0A8K0R4P3_9PLEO|nr:hypothetical protein FB567DRAFT_50344 [Paraphoma chrysanthemicola]